MKTLFLTIAVMIFAQIVFAIGCQSDGDCGKFQFCSKPEGSPYPGACVTKLPSPKDGDGGSKENFCNHRVEQCGNVFNPFTGQYEEHDCSGYCGRSNCYIPPGQDPETESGWCTK